MDGSLPREARRLFGASELPLRVDTLFSPTSGILCLGFLLTPDEARERVRDLHVPFPYWFIEFTTAGTANIQRAAIGLLARLPAESSLAAVAASYYGSNLPGYTDWMDWKTPFAEIAQLAERLRQIGLEVEPFEYSAFAEALVPIEFEAACRYVRANGLDVVANLSEDEEEFEFVSADAVPELRSPDALRGTLSAVWNAIEQQVDPSRMPRVGPLPLALAIIANSD